MVPSKVRNVIDIQKLSYDALDPDYQSTLQRLEHEQRLVHGKLEEV
jgi:hypothetical protein